MRFHLIQLLVSVFYLSFGRVYSEEIAHVISLIRHGSRAIYDNFNEETKLDLWGEKWDYLQELTPTGMRMHYILGYLNNLKYKDSLFLNLKVKDVVFISTIRNRTIESSFSHTAGLFYDIPGKTLLQSQVTSGADKPPVSYPNLDADRAALGLNALPENMNSFPIQNFNNEEMSAHLVDECSGKQKYMSENRDPTLSNKAFQDFYDKYGTKVANDIKVDISKITYSYLHSLCDAYFSDYFDSRELSAISDIGKEELYQAVLRFTEVDMLNYDFREKSNNAYYARITASRFVRKFFYYMNLKIANPSESQKYVIFTGHDTNINNLINYLNHVFEIQIDNTKYYPNYASEFKIELKKNCKAGPSEHSSIHIQSVNKLLLFLESIGEDTIVQLDDNAKDYCVSISFNNYPLLDLNYVDFADRMLKAAISNEEIDKMCRPSTSPASKMPYIIVIIVLSSLTLIVIVLLVIWHVKKMDYIEIEDEETVI